MPTTRTFRIRGTESTDRGDGFAPPRGELRLRQRSILLGASRGDPGDMPELAADDVVRVELDNGFVLWTRADDLMRERGRMTTHRGGAESWDIAFTPPRGTGGASRGWLQFGIKVLDVFGFDLAERAAAGLGGVLQKKLLHNAAGVYHCPLNRTRDDGPDLRLLPAGENIAASDRPFLVFVHGTASHCGGSFGKLWAGDNPAGATLRGRLHERYADRVYALEHHSLTESPINNALDLVKRLPEGAELHLVSHSRGGLIGELLCLGHRDTSGGDPLDDRLVDALFAADGTMAEQLGLGPLDRRAGEERDAAYAADRARLVELRDMLDARRIRVTRFVRAACPARGTTLASGRLDRWLSVLDHLSGNGLFGDTIDFLLAVVKERTDPRTLPGIEAMMPGSALTRLLAQPTIRVDADLSVIAGDIEGDSLFGQIKLLALDWFYDSDHDLVVNTGSMFGGLRRTAGHARYRVDRGPHVNHFNYFHNRNSVQWLEQGLTRGDADDGGFLAIGGAPTAQPTWREAVSRSQAVTTPRPLAVVLPGTMGSSLRADEEHIWLNYWKLLGGGLGAIRAGADDVEPVDLLNDFYGPLLEYLACSHRVTVFPYDWRASVFEAADRLAALLEPLVEQAERENQPLHLVAHSMGGLVVRAMIADGGRGGALWQRIREIDNSRFLMLGTPNHGSHEAVRWLTGANPTELKLALLDLTRGVDDIIDIVRGFPGLVELLPFAPAGTDFADPGLWKDLGQALDAKWKRVTGTTLRNARHTWDRLLAAEPDPDHMVYVAGCQAETVVDYRVVSDTTWGDFGIKRLAFDATADGDGTVTWDSGRLPGVPIYYVDDTAHDDLCTRKGAFPGYLDLLRSGTTTRLPDTPPLRRRDAGLPARFELVSRPFADAIPGPEEVRLFNFGGTPLRPLDARDTGQSTIRVRVTHGDLAYARHPVMVGHYLGDTIVSAEAVLDDRLDHALSRRSQFGLYPGRLRSHAVVFNENDKRSPKGAVVVGLGQVGELSQGLLEAGVKGAILDFALQVAQWPDKRFNAGEGPRSASLSVLLIGTGAGLLPVDGSVEALLRAAVAAADKLAEQQLDASVVIDEIEFIELYEDVAISACDALGRLLDEGNFSGRVVLEQGDIVPGPGRRRRVRCNEAQEWWQRLEIYREKPADGGPDSGGLRYVFASDRARAEQTHSHGQLSLAEGFVRQAGASPAADSEVSRTLFEMLLPNRLKELAPAQENLVLLVDEASAHYPWELLENRWSASGRPPAVAGGLVRQLRTPEFRAFPAHAVEAKAFVVGEPDLDDDDRFAPLPGARLEATEVGRVLRAGSFDVEQSLGQSAQDILHGLHRDAWRILHLAGHGVHSDNERNASGMVIGRDKLLTPGDVEQMRWVPELVFINCCHLGRTGPGRDHYARLAANLAVQFIKMGVKAVVAAGWAVDDAAAKEFASRFYATLLQGRTFGEAVRVARERTWVNHPRVNTWGAYQCYGDPSYCLRAGGGGRKAARNPAWRAPSELVAELENRTEWARVQSRECSGEETAREMQQRIEDAIRRIPEARRETWTGRADVAAAIGLAWGEIKRYGKAIDWLNRALAAEEGDCPVRVVEQSANFQVRLAGEQWSALPDAQRSDPVVQANLEERITNAIRELALVCERAPNTERLSLLGSACKRLAWLRDAEQPKLEALINMARYYRDAYELSVANNRPDSYPFTNWATARAILARLRGDPDDWQAAFDDECAEMIAIARETNERSPNLWSALGEADCEIARWLGGLEGNAGPTAIGRLYREALRRGASPRERASVVEHLDFCIATVNAIPDGRTRSNLRRNLLRIRREVA